MVKIGLAGLLSLILATVRSASFTTLPTDLLPFSLMVAQEILMGLVIGFTGNLIFMAISMAASMMGLQIGFGAANIFNPFLNVQTSALEQFYTLMAVALFLTIDGHHWLIRALARTFEVAPLGTFVLNNVTIEQLITVTGQTFVVTARISLPVVGTLLLTDFGLGLIARTVPQLQVFFIGLPLKIGLGLLILALTMALTLPVIKELLLDMVANILMISSPK